MYNTKLGRFCAEHENWEELLTAVPYNLKISEDGPYVMFKYNQLSSDFSNPIVQEARGIIFKKGKWEYPVCWAFNKFFNAQEPNAAEIDWNTAFVSEKLDGSLCKVWWDGEWKISTNGTIDAFKAELENVKYNSFGTYFCDTIYEYYNRFDDFTCILDPDYTYMFELIGPYNRVVVPYDEPAIYFIGARDKTTGEEFHCSKTVAGALSMGRFKLPKQVKLDSLNSCIEAVEAFGWDEEGFVVADALGNRVKIKSPAYVMAHYARNNNVITRKHLIKIILTNEVEEFLCYASDYKEELEKLQKLMATFYRVGESIADSAHALGDIPKRTFATWVRTLPNIYQGFAFRNYDATMSIKEYTAGWSENKWDDYLINFEKLKEDLFGG